VVKLRLALPVVAAVALVAASSAAAFTPTNTYYAKQWYLDKDHAFDAWPTPPPFQKPVKVGVIDSGVDCTAPDLNGRIAATKSFISGSNACVDTEGHGTIVAGEIAGNLNSGGIVGLAYDSQLLVAKVVADDGTIPLKAEAAGIVWAVKQGAKVINLSFGAVRDPAAPTLDSYSKVEAQAVAYAVSRGAVVVAAVGNADEAYATPWPYASWPSALPHVIGVAALTRSGNVPSFSDQDPRYVDLAAPGVDIFSTFPKLLTSKQQGCMPQGYTDCASGDYRSPEGTSFAAPQVSAAAAVLLGLNPSLTPSQVSYLLDHHADDVDAASGCSACPGGRDKYSGWGRLDVQKAVAALTSGAPLPPSDRFEPNDDVDQAHTLWGRTPSVAATMGYWDDPVDIYRVKLESGQRLQARVQAQWAGAAVAVTLWRPGTTTVLKGRRARWRVAQSAHAGRTEALTYRARQAGWYYVELEVTRKGAGRYSLQLKKSS
jgi:subtilisin family serine protease